jgi:hypothetical protein
MGISVRITFLRNTLQTRCKTLRKPSEDVSGDVSSFNKRKGRPNAPLFLVIVLSPPCLVSAPPPLRSALHRPATSTGGQKDSTTTVHLETRWLGQKKWFLCPGSTLYPLNTNKLLLLLLLLGYCSGTGLVLLYRCTVCVIMYIMYSISSTLPCDRTPVLFLCFILHRSWAFKAGL